MSSFNPLVLFFWGIILLFLGAITVIIWAYSHEEKDDLDDKRRTRVIKKIEQEIDRIRNDEDNI